MHMRLLQLKINAHELQSFCTFYENRIMPALQTIGGCLHACLVQSTMDAGEVISLTLWESEEHASTYERSGLFMTLVGEARPFFANTSEWKLQLSKDFTLEYAPDMPEPTVKSFSVSTSSAGQIPAIHRASQSFLRIVSVHLRPGKLQDYRDAYEREIIPALLSTHGCQFACLSTPTNESNEAISVTLWKSRADANQYEHSGKFDALLGKVKHTFSDLSQLKMESAGTRLPSVTSEDIEVDGFHLVAAKSF